MTKRSKRRLYAEYLLLAVLAGIFMGQSPSVFSRMTGTEFFAQLVDIRHELVTNYVEQPDEKEMLLGAIDGMIDSLDDRYTVYFTQEQLESFNKQTEGSFTGIGAEIREKDHYIEIVSPLEDSPAFKAGLSAGDLILAVDGESLEGFTSREAVERITGKEGTQVTLTVRYKATGKESDLTITRRRIEIQTVKGATRDETGHWNYMLDETNRIGYIRMTQFSEPTYDALTAALDELETQGMRGLILDLRYNPGGLLTSAVEISDLFLEDGVIVSTKGRRSPERKWEARSSGTLDDFPLLVLINEGSASASEILSGALRDNGRAILLGTRTVGKGSVQQIIPLEGGNGGVKLTTSYYYLPNGSNIHKREGEPMWGVDPSDGFYVAMSHEEQVEMMEIRRSSDIIRPAGEQEDNGHAAISPDWIEQELKDKQLARGLETILARVNDGQWIEVGPNDTTVQELLKRKNDLVEGRDAYFERIEKIDEELDKIDRLLREEEVEDDSVVAVDDNADSDTDPDAAIDLDTAEEGRALEPVEAMP